MAGHCISYRIFSYFFLGIIPEHDQPPSLPVSFRDSRKHPKTPAQKSPGLSVTDHVEISLVISQLELPESFCVGVLGSSVPTWAAAQKMSHHGRRNGAFVVFSFMAALVLWDARNRTFTGCNCGDMHGRQVQMKAVKVGIVKCLRGHFR